MQYYAGIGSRETPDNILEVMSRVGSLWAQNGWILRSGGAEGADTAFALGCTRKKILRPEHSNPGCELVAQAHHPAWNHLNGYVRKLMGRNALIVLGDDLRTPVSFVACWTPDGAISKEETSVKTGGTGLAIRLASSEGIPVFNLKRDEHLERVLRAMG